MSKRNFILLIIVLAVLGIFAFGFFYFYQPATQNPTSTIESPNFLANFLPFGKSKTTTPKNNTAPVDVSENTPSQESEAQIVKLKKVSSFPVAGYGIFMKERFKEIANPKETQTNETATENPAPSPTSSSTEFMPAIRYVNKANGNIYQTFADRIDERKFSSTVIPKVYEAYFGNKGDSVVMRYLKEDGKKIETFVGALAKEYLGADSVGTSEIKSSFLPENISDISVSSDNSKIFYLFETGDNVVGVTYSLQTNSKTQIFDSPSTEWLSSWPSSKMLTLTTKPSASVPGFMYVINPDRKDFNKILGSLGGINGLTTLGSPDGKKILYSDNNLSLSLFDIITGSSTVLGVKTLPEKCVWGSGITSLIYCAVPTYIDQVAYPDSWYRGEVSFTDQIWKIDAESGNTTMVSDPLSIESGEAIDGVKLNLDDGQNYLFFVNKKDSYLWKLSLR